MIEDGIATVTFEKVAPGEVCNNWTYHDKNNNGNMDMSM